MKYQPMDVAVIKGNWWNPMALVIYQRTSTFWSHCVVLKDETGNIFDATMGGIKNSHISHYAKRDMIIRRYKYDFNPKLLLDWCSATQKSCKEYDYLALLGFLTGVKKFESSKYWYCAEFPFWAFMANNKKISDCELTFIYPNFFLINNDFITIDS